MLSDRTRGLLGWAIIIAVLLIGFSAWSYARTYSRSIEPTAFRSFSVSGEGKVVAKPDIATFTYGVVSEGGTDIAALNKENTDRGNKIISFLKGEGVEDEDVKTEEYNISPRYQNSFCRVGACPPPTIVGYTVTQSVSVKVRDFDKIGAILSGAVERGANNVSQLNFTIDDPVGVENEARAKAIAEARAKAEMVAKAGDFSVGRLLGIDEGGFRPYYAEKAIQTMSFDSAMGSALPAPSIEPGSQDVVVTVTLRYEIN